MKAIQPSSKKELLWKCREHPHLLCDFIALDENTKYRFLCFNCMKKSPIPTSHMISMNFILKAQENEVIEGYPPLNDPGLFNKLQNNYQNQSFEEISRFFNNLRADFEIATRQAEKKAKEAFIQIEAQNQAGLKEYFKFAEIDKLKQLILSKKITAERDIDSFIRDKCRNAEAFKERIQNALDQQSAQSRISFEGPMKKAQEIIDRVKNISFFESKNELFQRVDWIKSTFGTSQQMEITKLNNSTYQFQQNAIRGWGQIFLNPVLNPLHRYVFHVEVEAKQGHQANHFVFGIVRDQGKDNAEAQEQKMSYYDFQSGYGIQKQIKGNPMPSQGRRSENHSFEMRIDLNERIVRVASLPDYSSVAELDNLNKIDPNSSYRFYVSIFYQGDIMRITKMEIVDRFDDKM